MNSLSNFHGRSSNVLKKYILKSIKFLLVLILIACLVFVPPVVMGRAAFSNMTDFFTSVRYMFKGGTGYPVTLEDNGTNSNVTNIGNSVALISSKNVSIFNSKAYKLLNVDVDYTQINVRARNGRAIVYSIGQPGCKVISRTDELFDIETNGDAVMTATIGKNAYTAVATYSDSCKSTLKVFDKKGEVVFSSDCFYYISDISLSDNGKKAVVVDIEIEDAVINSRLIILNLEDINDKKEFDYNGVTIYDVSFDGNNRVIALGDKLISVIGRNMERSDVDFGDDEVLMYDISESNNSAVVFGRLGNSEDQKLVLFNSNGEKLFEKDVEGEVCDISCSKSFVSILTDSKVITYNNRGDKRGEICSAERFNSVEICDDKLYLYGNGMLEKFHVNSYVEQEKVTD